MDCPLVSVVVPIYRVEKYIEECIYSILSQTYKNIELVLIDDCGNDDSVRIAVSAIEQKNENVNYKLVKHSINRGLSAARNSGVSNSSGDYILFIDSDDFIADNTIEELLRPFENNENLGICSAPCFYSYENGNISLYNESWDIHNIRIIEHNEFFAKSITQYCNHSACAKLYRKDICKAVLFREGKRNEDTLYMNDLAEYIEINKLQMIEIPQPLYYYRSNIGSITKNWEKPILKDIVDNLHLLKEETKNQFKYEVLIIEYYKSLLSFLDYLILQDNNQVIRLKYYNSYKHLLKDECIIDILKKLGYKYYLKSLCHIYCSKILKLYYKYSH